VTAHWSVPDPAAGDRDDDSYPVFKDVADEIEDRVALLLGDLKTAQPERNGHG